MAWLADMWPFTPGQQHAIFYVTGLSIIGLIALNIYSALRQGMPILKVMSGLFMEIPNASASEKRIRLVLLGFLLLGFLVLIVDIQVNGMQMVDTNWAKGR
ncbi:MAG TPA: hypothetical protein VH881_05875 [Burkholderiales bacterium]|jgi:hypothetical protein